MKKRSFAFLMALMLGLSLAGCSENTDKAEKKDKEELDDMDVVFSYDDPSEYITIPDDYIGIEVSGPQEVTDAEVQQQIEYARYMNMKTEEIREGIVKEGDGVHIYCKGILKGEETPFETSEYDVTIGSGEMIPGFEEGLIGAKVGDTVQLELTFPEEYSGSELAGKTADFVVTIEYICGKFYVSDWTDEFVQGITNGEYKNTVDYEAALRRELQSNKDEEIFYTQQAEIISYLVENSVVHKFPEGLVETQYDNFLEEYEQEIEKNDEYTNLEDYVLAGLEYPSMEKFYNYIQENAEKTAIELLAYQAVAYKEDLTLTKVEYDNFLQTLASTQGYTTASKFEEDYMNAHKEQGEDFLYKRFLNQKVLEFLQAKAKPITNTAKE